MAMPSVLLLDCSYELLDRLQRQGFDVEYGTIGFVNGIRRLPSQIYEKEVIIYNPGLLYRGSEGKHVASDEINNFTPEFDLGHIKEHVERGATLLVFINRISDKIEGEKAAYSWIPAMPSMGFTKDNKPVADNYIAPIFLPLINENELKLPVAQKFNITRESIDPGQPFFYGLLYNQNEDVLSFYVQLGDGLVVFLPEYQSNDDVITTFLTRIVPKLHGTESRVKLADKFLSPDEIAAQEKIKKAHEDIENAKKKLEEAHESFATARRIKETVIKEDEVAVAALNYFDTALQQKDVALFFLYKAVEKIEDKLGGEARTKSILGCSSELVTIKRAANESYGDIRHAPKVGEKIKGWTQGDIDKCFKATEEIIVAYLGRLFQKLRLT